jgi:cell wall-associated NlpC family hydrolase
MQSGSRLQPILRVALACACLGLLALAGSAWADDGGGAAAGSGGTAFVPPPPPPEKAMIVNGKAIAPANAPARIKRVINAANRLIGKPYRYGGGHRAYSSRKLDRGYDCSGSVSYALHGGRFLRSPLASGDLMSWARSGPGTWLTVYANGGHAYMYVAGLRFDTSMRDDPSRTGPGWSKKLRKNASYVPRHPRGY